ncbi:MAG: hypothetical protein Q4D98_00735 [Planctomycetia bacterium]|nr:hypothetical protein [Planctomycetia bacterium]
MKTYRLTHPVSLIHKDGTAAREAATVQLACDGKNLVFIAEMIDSDIHNAARKNNVKTWQTGDVIELFFQPPGREDYYEFHVTPEGKTLQLHLPNGLRAQTDPFETMICETGFRASAQIWNGRWTVRMEIPLAAMNASRAVGGRTAMARHNYNKNWEKPEVTVSTPLVGTIHHPEEWPIIVQEEES